MANAIRIGRPPKCLTSKTKLCGKCARCKRREIEQRSRDKKRAKLQKRKRSA